MSELFVGAGEAEPEDNLLDDVEDGDSVCSWMSESESVVHNWRGWKGPSPPACSSGKRKGGRGEVSSLCELAAISVASWIPFELVEAYYPPVPEELQLRIAYWSFPDSEEDIRLYSCLANGCVEEYAKGEALLRSGAVRESLQIGFHLSASVIPPDGKPPRSTSLTFDRKRIVSCQCSCEAKADWCSHVVASSLHRIQRPVTLRAPVSESLSRLRRDQLQKFAQYLIAELPLQILPAAQKILDELLCPGPSPINSLCGAPDPTAGGSASETSAFYLDDKNLKVNISRILIKFCVPSPLVFSDVNYLSTTPPLSSAEWTSLLRPLRGREPEGIWNLLSIVREMFRRSDHNALPLLEILTGQTIETAQIMVWWFTTKSSALRSLPPKASGNTQASQNACAYLCDEIVTLWKLAALNPVISPRERELLKAKLLSLHSAVISKIQANQNGPGAKAPARNKASELEAFPGFKPAIEGTALDWSGYPIPGVTYGHNATYVSPFAVFKGPPARPGQVNSSQAVLRCEFPGSLSRPEHPPPLHEADEGVELGRAPQEVDDSDSSEDKGGGGAVGPPGPGEDHQYRVYFYEAANSSPSGSGGPGDKEATLDVFKNLRNTIEDPWEVLFLRAEGLYAHGFMEHACSLAAGLAHDLLKSNLDLLSSLASPGAPTPQGGGHKRHKRAACHAVTLSASNTLSQAGFLASVLLENPQYHSLAFQIALFGLELPRPPASSKPLEVKLAHQEGELVAILKKIPIGPWEMKVIREKAAGLKEGTLKSRGEALLPLSLATFVFESLCLQPNGAEGSGSILYTDEILGFEAAVEAIGMKSSVSEADHPLLCEGTRRQRGELVLLLLLTYKNDPVKIAKIMDKLLDKEVHPLFKAPITPQLYATGATSGSPGSIRRVVHQFDGLSLRSSGEAHPPPPPPSSSSSVRGEWGSLLDERAAGAHDGSRNVVGSSSSNNNNNNVTSGQKEPSSSRRNPRPDSDSGSSGNSSAESVDSSSSSSTRALAPESSMSNAGQRSGGNQLAHGSALASASQGGPPGGALASWGGPSRKGMAQGYHGVHGGPSNSGNHGPVVVVGGGGHRGKSSVSRYRGSAGKRPYPSLPNQPSESLAHFMYELAKTVLTKAGGSTSSSLFNQELSSSSRGPHRALLMAAFQIGLYSLGLYNAVSPNWLSRTYSSQVHWVTSQALEIGAPAIIFLISTWEGHLSPPEAASIADRVSRGRDSSAVKASSELALSVLPHSSALKVMEIQRAMAQCQAQSTDMLERACAAVEKAASNGGGVHPEVLFEVARHWHALWQKNNSNAAAAAAASSSLIQPSATNTVAVAANSPQLATAVLENHYAAYPLYGIFSRFPSSVQMYVSPHLSFQRLALAAAPSAYYPPAAVAAAAAAAANPRVFGGGAIYAPPPHIHQVPPQLGHPSNPPPPVVPHHPLHLAAVHPPGNPPPQPPGGPNPSSTNASPPLAPGGPSQRFLISAYRVGMLALESLGRRASEERSDLRLAQNPPYGADVLWLKSIAKMLGLTYFQNFLVVVGATIASPFLLQDLALEGALHLSGAGGGSPNGPGGVSGGGTSSSGPPVPGSGSASNNLPGYSPPSIMTSIRSNPHLTQLANKCYQMYYQCIHQRLFQLAPEDYEEFTGIILHARKAFYWTVEGPRTFQTLLQSIRRSKSCTKELWQKVLSSVQNTSLETPSL